eukprot:292322-Chlamydomonas_euryale.AAC.14
MRVWNADYVASIPAAQQYIIQNGSATGTPHPHPCQGASLKDKARKAGYPSTGSCHSYPTPATPILRPLGTGTRRIRQQRLESGDAKYT